MKFNQVYSFKNISWLLTIVVDDHDKCAECDAAAKFSCPSCPTYLCADHDKTIHRLKSFSDHVRKPYEKLPTCWNHKKSQATKYCLECDFLVSKICFSSLIGVKVCLSCSFECLQSSHAIETIINVLIN